MGAAGRLGVGLSTMIAATSWVTNASWVAVGWGVEAVVSPIISGRASVGVIGWKTAGSGVEVGAKPPSGVGVVYCPHRDALPTHDAVNKETAINRPESRLTFRPLRELYL